MIVSSRSQTKTRSSCSLLSLGGEFVVDEEEGWWFRGFGMIRGGDEGDDRRCDVFI